MLFNNSFYRLVLLALIALPIAAGCASTSYIEVTYQLPEPQQNIDQKAVALQVVDQRPTETIAGPNAKKELEYFTGLFRSMLPAKGKSRCSSVRLT